ncbi:DUF4181 domain-containing protein [Actinomycetes bacterium NPDC127524]
MNTLAIVLIPVVLFLLLMLILAFLMKKNNVSMESLESVSKHQRIAEVLLIALIGVLFFTTSTGFEKYYIFLYFTVVSLFRSFMSRKYKKGQKDYLVHLYIAGSLLFFMIFMYGYNRFII